MASGPLIIQSDQTILLDTHAEEAEAARAAILPFAELEKSPEHVHTYRISPLSLWNAAAAGLEAASVRETLERYSRYPVQEGLFDGLSSLMARYGRLVMRGGEGDSLRLEAADEALRTEIAASRPLRKYLQPAGEHFALALRDRGTVKRELIRLGWPVADEAPLIAGEDMDISLKEGAGFAPRNYQREAAAAVLGSGGPGSGYGVVVLPCGAGKTVVGMCVMAALKTNTLILCTNAAAVHQWISELLDKTTLAPDEIAEYSGTRKGTAPVTVATYQIITWRPKREEVFPHFALFRERPWGLIIYDEVHLLPAPLFRITAELQAVRRLGLTATLVREDGEEDAVFSLVGPKRYDAPWKDLEQKGWIASAYCTEIRIALPEELRIPYAAAPPREKCRLAGENPRKDEAVADLVANHPDEQIIVIGQYLAQLEGIARRLGAPLITGKMRNDEREKHYAAFKRGETRVIVTSKVANFAIDLPDASMAIQVSGAFGSRQEEAQRLGRILRPKKRDALFFTLVSHCTVEEDFSLRRRQFLAEQGYKYRIQHWEG
ncbi:MAG: DEAD/DEAH box helicase [Treponema sp.]|jgi:DNA excision repair protein ERCC-3|nr:DEAD/DEAH box helicase [Treponema sp.]